MKTSIRNNSDDSKSIHKEKQKIRRAALALRDELSPHEVDERSALVQKNVLQSKEFEQAKTIGAYYPKGSEVRTMHLIEVATSQGKKVGIPKLDGHDMFFCVYEPDGPLVRGMFGVMEPSTSKRLESGIDLLLVPGLAFDRTGGRVGYGKGYYDRYIANESVSYSMGLAYSLQIMAADMVPIGRYDRKLDAVACEQEIMRF